MRPLNQHSNLRLRKSICTTFGAEIQVVSFDAAGTLFHPSPSVGFHYADVAKSFGISADPDFLEARFRGIFRARGGLSSLEGKSSEARERAWWKETVSLVFKDMKMPSDIEPFFDALYHRFASKEAWALYPEVLPTLSALKKKGLTLAVLSNWDSRLFALLEALNVRSYFEEVIISARSGATKPHREIFDKFSKAVGCDQTEIMHVGDNFLCDVEGATQAGFHAVFLARGKPAEEQTSNWTGPTINNLEQILALFPKKA